MTSTEATKEKVINKLPPTETPKQIQNGFGLVSFVRAIFDRDKDDDSYLVFELSFPLTEEHEKYIPAKALKAWKALKACDLNSLEVKNIPLHEINLSPSPEGDEELSFGTSSVSIEKLRLTNVVEKGTGKKREYVRLSFRLRFELEKDAVEFASVHFGRPIWLRWKQLQEEMFN
jgi:hypothetical protein